MVGANSCQGSLQDPGQSLQSQQANSTYCCWTIKLSTYFSPLTHKYTDHGTATTSKYTSVHIHRDQVPAKIEFYLPKQYRYPLAESMWNAHMINDSINQLALCNCSRHKQVATQTISNAANLIKLADGAKHRCVQTASTGDYTASNPIINLIKRPRLIPSPI